MKNAYVTKIFKITDIDCADCARKMEERANRKVEDVTVTVNFLTERLSITAPATKFDEKFKEIEKQMRKIERDFEISKLRP